MAVRSSDRRPRRRRADGSEHVALAARITPHAKRMANAGAEARGMTLSLYLEQLLQTDPIAQEFLRNQMAQGELDLEESA